MKYKRRVDIINAAFFDGSRESIAEIEKLAGDRFDFSKVIEYNTVFLKVELKNPEETHAVGIRECLCVGLQDKKFIVMNSQDLNKHYEEVFI